MIERRWIVLFLLPTILAVFSCRPPDEEEEESLDFVDEALEECVRDALDQDEGDLEDDDLAELRNLECQALGIADIHGMQRLTGLETLSLWENEIVDLAPLAELTDLRELQLGHNRIETLDPLTGLTDLQHLGLSVNQIRNLDALTGLVELQWLNLDRNQLKGGDMDELCGLDELTWVTLDHNFIDDDDDYDCLTDAGVEVYADYQADPDDRSAPGAGWAASDLPLGSGTAPVERAAPGRLDIRATDGGEVELVLDTAAGDVPVLREFPGRIVREGDSLVYVRGTRRVAVGHVHQGGFELCDGPFAAICQLSVGRKGPGTESSADHMLGRGAVVASATLRIQEDPRPGTDWQFADGDGDEDEYGIVNEELLPYVLASPNQYDAGSCLFMATTGSMEILMGQQVDEDDIGYWGETDLSERYLMNASDYVGNDVIDWVLSDLIYAYEDLGGSMLDRDYPFQAGYIKDGVYGVTEATPNESGAYFSCYYSWLNHLPDDWEDMLVDTPAAERTVVFIDPDKDSNSQWAVALGDEEIIEQIKYELRTKNAPVMVVYNHFLYWHADIIVGYDDTVEYGCPMVNQSIQYFNNNGGSSYANQIEAHMEDEGGCREKGIFYVRDSIYDGGDDEPMYEYSEQYGFEEKYSQRIIQRSYDWVKYLGNHAYTVHRR